MPASGNTLPPALSFSAVETLAELGVGEARRSGCFRWGDSRCQIGSKTLRWRGAMRAVAMPPSPVCFEALGTMALPELAQTRKVTDH